MTESEIQQLLQNQTGGGTGIPDTSSILNSALEPLMPLLTITLIVGAVLTVIIVIFFIINIVQKQRQHSAIMRIDRNLQKIVDAKGLSEEATPRVPTPVTTAEPTADTSS